MGLSTNDFDGTVSISFLLPFTTEVWRLPSPTRKVGGGSPFGDVKDIVAPISLYIFKAKCLTEYLLRLVNLTHYFIHKI